MERSLASSEQEDTLPPLPPFPPSSCPLPGSMAASRSSMRPKGILRRSTALSSASEPLSPASTIGSPYASFMELTSGVKSKRVSLALPEDYQRMEPLGSGDTTDVHSQAAEYLNTTETTSTDTDMRTSLLADGATREKRKRLQKLRSTLDFDALARNELELKANLFFHIGNPVKRWRVERVVPIKLLLQLLKSFCLLTQVILFTFTIAHQRSTFFYETQQVFSSLFIKDYEYDSTESTRKYTAFTIDELEEELNFVALRFYSLPDLTIGGYEFQKDNGSIVAPTVTIWQYREAVLNASDNVYVLDGRIDSTTFPLLPPSVQNVSEQIVANTNDPLFNKFVGMRIKIPVKNIRVVRPARAECYLLTAEMFFVNDLNNGLVQFHLKVISKWEDCHGTINTPHDQDTIPLMQGFLTALNAIVIVLCLMSLFLTFTTLRRAAKLGRAMGSFYKEQLGLPLNWWDRRSLFSPWHLSNFISDCLIISGTVFHILLDFFVIDDAAATRVLLGTALLFQAAAILRYISYFKQLNALTRTLKMALPELLRFLLCAFILFIAFTFCGWLVLGPFHPRFRTVFTTMDALFGLLNGDDIHETYVQISPLDNMVAYVYSRLFFYIFLTLFIYAVLNLFTSLIISAYEESQHKDAALENEVTRFVFSGPLTPRGVALRDVTNTKKYVDPQVILSRRDTVHTVQESFEYL